MNEEELACDDSLYHDKYIPFYYTPHKDQSQTKLQI